MGTVPALLQSPEAGGGGRDAVPAPAGLFSSLLGGESGQKIKGRPGPAGHCQEPLGPGARSGRRTAVRRRTVLRAHSRVGEGWELGVHPS